MYKIFFYYSLFVSFSIGASIKTFHPNEPIKASEMNSNFSHISSSLSSKNISMSFRLFQIGELILRDSIEAEFDKLRLLGVDIDALSSQSIKAEELNVAFIQSSEGIISYDDIPTTNNFSFSLNEDSSFSGTAPFVNLVGESRIQIVSQPSSGLISVGSGVSFTYQPNLNFNGLDTFNFKIFDGLHYSSVASASISVMAVNDAPISSGQIIEVVEDTPASILLVASDVDLDTLSYIIINQPANGVLTGTAPNLTYTPNVDYSGSDSFSFKVNDGEIDSNTSVVTINISAVNDAPVIQSTLALGVNINGAQHSSTIVATDPDDTIFTFSIMTPPTKGVAAINNTGLLTYTPSLNMYGTDTFQVRVSDGKINSNTMTVSVAINGTGIIIVGTSRTYFDGSVGTSCNDYKSREEGSYTYSGQVGDGLYSIKPDAGTAFNAYCDMTRDGGGWTMVVGFNGNGWDMSYYDNVNVGWKSTNGSGTFNGTNLNYASSYWSPAYARVSGTSIKISNDRDRLTWNLPSSNNLRKFVETTPTNYSAATATAGFSFNAGLSYRVSSNSTNLATRWNNYLKLRCVDGRGNSTDNAVIGFTSDQVHGGYYCEGFGYPSVGNHEYRKNTRWYAESVGYNVGPTSEMWRSDSLNYNIWIR